MAIQLVLVIVMPIWFPGSVRIRECNRGVRCKQSHPSDGEQSEHDRNASVYLVQPALLLN